MKIVGKILSVIYSIIFTAVVLVLTVGLSCASLLNPSVAKNLVTEVDLGKVSASELGLTEKNINLEEYIVGEITKLGIDGDIASDILNNEEIKEVIGDVAGRVITFIVSGSEIPQISEDEVNRVLSNEKVKQLFDADFNEEDIHEIVNMANDFLREFALDWGVNNGIN